MVALIQGERSFQMKVPRKGWVLVVERTGPWPGNRRLKRTVGTYHVYHDGVAVPKLSGGTAERQGPSDNGAVGKREHRRVEAGTYPARTHDTTSYKTSGYKSSGQPPKPAIGLGGRGASMGSRDGILVHPASGTGSTIGCINLGPEITGPDTRLVMRDSLRRVVAVIDDLKAYAGSRFPGPDSEAVPDAFVMIVDPPG